MSSEIQDHGLATPEGWRLEHQYAQLPALLHERWEPTPVKEPRLLILNEALASELGLDAEALRQRAAVFAGNELPPGAKPLAQAYAGHQFGNFTGLGDGRALLLGEQITPEDRRFDIQLKGAGPTPFSRGGDGRAAIGPMLREYVISEAMHALGIHTTRSLAVAATGEVVFRKQGLLPGAVLTRVAASHIRVGTFQWAAAHQDLVALRALTEHTLERHYPELLGAENPALSLLEAALKRQASLIARWMQVGFIHGVMNTDNVALAGETIDYGPCAFMDEYDPKTTFSSIDRRGRYAFGNQPQIAQWNAARLAEALLPILHPDENKALELANSLIEKFADFFQLDWLTVMRAKLGLFTTEAEDRTLIQDLLNWMQNTKADYTQTFAALAMGRLETNEWQTRWQQRLSRQTQSHAESVALMRRHNPAVIPRNHKVEEALAAASDHDDLNPLHRLLTALANPYDHELDLPIEFTEAPPACNTPYQTFCGT